MLGAVNSFALDFSDFDSKPCASLVNVQQTCEEDGTVTLTFHVANNTTCSSSAITLIPDHGIGQSYPISTPGGTVSSTSITYSGATPGSTLCFTVILHGSEGTDCCTTTVCLEVDCCGSEGCCDLEAEVIDQSCGPNAWVRISVTGGTQPYSGPGNQVGVPGNFIVTGLSAGTYTYTYTDSAGCEVEVTFTIQGEKCCGFDAQVVDQSCAPDAWVRINVSGGTPPYSGPGNQVGAIGNFIVTGLSAGTYTYTYTDSNGCAIDVTFTIQSEEDCCELEATLADQSCAPNAWVRIVVSGGTQPYSGPGMQVGTAGNFVVTGLSAGTYTYTYTDSEGCEAEVTFTIIESDLQATPGNTGGCPPDAWAVVSVTGGTQPYSGPGQEIGTAGNFVIQGLDAGTHTFTYTDSDGCTAQATVTIDEGPELTSLATTSSDCTDGTVEITLSGGTAPYYGPDNQQSSSGYFFYGGLAPGNYVWTFFDADGCEVEVSFTITVSTGTCSQFTFSRDENDNTGTNIYQETITSTISAMIYVSLWADFVPDRLIVNVNGVEVVNFSSGSSNCDGPSPETVIDSFCVTYCDVVEFTVLGDICPLGGTWWDLDVTCEEKDGGSSLNGPSGNLTSRKNNQRRSDNAHDEIRLRSSQNISVYPNPANDIVNFINQDPLINFKSISITNNSGQILLIDQNLNDNALQIDVSSFPQGVYIVELINNYDQRVIKKFTKLE